MQGADYILISSIDTNFNIALETPFASLSTKVQIFLLRIVVKAKNMKLVSARVLNTPITDD